MSGRWQSGQSLNQNSTIFGADGAHSARPWWVVGLQDSCVASLRPFAGCESILLVGSGSRNCQVLDATALYYGRLCATGLGDSFSNSSA